MVWFKKEWMIARGFERHRWGGRSNGWISRWTAYHRDIGCSTRFPITKLKLLSPFAHENPHWKGFTTFLFVSGLGFQTGCRICTALSSKTRLLMDIPRLQGAQTITGTPAKKLSARSGTRFRIDFVWFSKWTRFEFLLSRFETEQSDLQENILGTSHSFLQVYQMYSDHSAYRSGG